MLGLALSPVSSFSQEPPPKAVPGNLVTDYQSIKVEDPYRALEDLKSGETQAWAAANAAFARHQLDRLSGRKALFDRITALDAERSPVIQSLTQVCQLLTHFPVSSAANPHGCWSSPQK